MEVKNQKQTKRIRRVNHLAGVPVVQTDYLPASWFIALLVGPVFMCCSLSALAGALYVSWQSTTKVMAESISGTPLPTFTASPTVTFTPWPTFTPSKTLTPIATWTPQSTWTPVPTWTPMPTFTASPTATPTMTITPMPTATLVRYTFQQLQENPNLITTLNLSSTYKIKFYRAICYTELTDKFVQPRVAGLDEDKGLRWRLWNDYGWSSDMAFTNKITFYLSDNSSVFHLALYRNQEQLSDLVSIDYPRECRASQFIYLSSMGREFQRSDLAQDVEQVGK